MHRLTILIVKQIIVMIIMMIIMIILITIMRQRTGSREALHACRSPPAWAAVSGSRRACYIRT